jgi:hypothetical protein
VERRGEGRRRSEPRERFSDPGEERSPISRAAIGCGIGCVALLLAVGVVGIGIGAQRRLAGWGRDEPEGQASDDRSERDTDDRPAEGTSPPTPPQAPPPAPVDDMRQRYRPGPYARIDSMVPSGRLLPTTVPGTVVSGRTVDNPWIVPGSELLPTAAPTPSGGGPTVSHAAGEPYTTPLTVVTRTPSRVQVRAADARGGTAITAYLVEMVGYPGHFRLPATAPTELGAVTAAGSDGATIHFAILSPTRPYGGGVAGPGETFPVTLRVAAVDDGGRVSPFLQRELTVTAVGAGDVEVTLTMGEPTDLDLYVTDPTTTTVYYGNNQAGSGGHLDLDANAACSSNMGVNNEHIYWPAGRAPAGTYRVNVAHWRNCIQGRAVSYRITVRACGETVVLTGQFEPGQGNGERCFSARPEDRAWCQEVVTFDVPPCAPAAGP